MADEVCGLWWWLLQGSVDISIQLGLGDVRLNLQSFGHSLVLNFCKRRPNLQGLLTSAFPRSEQASHRRYLMQFDTASIKRPNRTPWYSVGHALVRAMFAPRRII